MWITHCYLGTKRGKARCLFFLLHEDYIEAQAGLSEKLRQEIERFARNMRDFGAVIAPFAGDAEKIREHILDKPWPKSGYELIRPTPALLMIDQDFDDFDPRAHQWIILHLDGESGDASQFRSLLQKLVQALPDKESDPFRIIREAQKQLDIAEATEMFELKPGILGMSIDLKHAWKSLKTYLREKKNDDGHA